MSAEIYTEVNRGQHMISSVLLIDCIRSESVGGTVILRRDLDTRMTLVKG